MLLGGQDLCGTLVKAGRLVGKRLQLASEPVQFVYRVAADSRTMSYQL
jgi:hypothetical protein